MAVGSGTGETVVGLIVVDSTGFLAMLLSLPLFPLLLTFSTIE